MLGLVIYSLLFITAILGLILIGIRNKLQQQQRLYQDAIRQLRVVSMSRRR